MYVHRILFKHFSSLRSFSLPVSAENETSSYYDVLLAALLHQFIGQLDLVLLQLVAVLGRA